MERVAVVLNSLGEKESYFREAVDSILAQNGVDIRLILSTVEGDKCLEWAKDYASDNSNKPKDTIYTEYDKFWKKHIISKDSHGGKSPAGSFTQLNSAINSHLLDTNDYDWFCFASSNDVLLPDKMITEINSCIVGGQSDFSDQTFRYIKKVGYSNLTPVDENLQSLKRKTIIAGEYSYQRHLGSNFVPDTSMIHRTILQKYAPFAMKWQNMGYYDFWLRVYEGEGNIFAYTNVSNYLYRQNPEGMHRRNKEDKKNVNIAKRRMRNWHIDKGGLYNADGTLDKIHYAL